MRSLLLLSLLAAMLPRAAAQERPAITLAWVRGAGAESCPSTRELQERVGERLAYDPFAMDAPVSLEAVVERVDDEWTIHVYKRGPAGELLGERSLVNRANDCEALADAVVLALALAIDPDAALRARPEAPAGAAAAEEDAAPADPPAEPTADPPVQPPPSPTATAAPRDRARLAIGAALARSQVPGWGYGLRLTVDGPVVGPFLRWTVDAQLWPEQEAADGTTRLGVGTSHGSAGLCAGRRFARGSLHGCAAVAVGALHVVVYDPVPRDPGDRVFLAARASIRGSVRLSGPVQLGLFGGVVVPLIDHDLNLAGNPTPVFSPARVAPVAGVELLVDL